MRLLLRVVAAFALAWALVVPALAREEIRSFTSAVELLVDGSVRVTETIEVNAEGIDIRRGIYRDIPVMMAGSDGARIRPDLEVQSVKRDGRAEPFRLERMGEFQRIWIGDPDVLLSRSVITYELRYTLTRMARSFDDHDELYWNATGNYWIFPILSARATVTLPNGAVIGDLVGYTGVVGSTEQAVAIKRQSDTVAAFRSTRALGPGEGMTIAVAFNKGVLSYPEGLSALQQRIGDFRDLILPVLAVLLAIAYNTIAWFRVGRDPAKGTIIPLFHPPKGFSPALVHYVHNWGFKNGGWSALTAALFDLGVKGLVTIDNTGKDLRIFSTGKQPAEPLPVGEQVIFDFVRAEQDLPIDKTTGTRWASELQKMQAAINKENYRVWFRANVFYSFIGVVLAAALLFGMVYFGLLDPAWLIGALFGGIFLSVVVAIIGNMLRKFTFISLFGLLWVGIFLFNMGGAVLDGLSYVSVNSAVIAAFSIVAVTAVFATLMGAPTVRGRKAMDEIDGLKMYIETAEKNRLNIDKEPPMTTVRFEQILPYAIALGVEKPWSAHFEAELGRNAVADAGPGYQPIWYSGGDFGSSVGRSTASMTNAVSAAAASMTAAMVAAQPVQASSSGFSSGGGGGGGSSGGGGGGGGGGGW